MTAPKSEQPDVRLIPYAGFRFVFGLVNAAIWFALAFGITSGISIGVAQNGRLTSNTATIFASTVAFFVFFFGLPGALSGFLDQARQGRIALPNPNPQGSGGPLSAVWRIGFIRGIVAASIIYEIAKKSLAPEHPPARSQLCLILGALAAFLAFVNAWLASRPSSLLDLEKKNTPPETPTNQYFLQRVGIPQAFGNGLISALVAMGTFPAGEEAKLPPMNAAIDSLITGVVIASFMVVSAGGLVGLDCRLGRIALIRGSRPSKLARLSLVLGAAAIGAAIALGLASMTNGLSLAMIVPWKGILGASVAGLFAVFAARWEITDPASS